MGCFCGANGDVPCVCETQAELADTPDTGEIDQRFILAPMDTRDEYRSPEDWNPPAWEERYEH